MKTITIEIVDPWPRDAITLDVKASDLIDDVKAKVHFALQDRLSWPSQDLWLRLHSPSRGFVWDLLENRKELSKLGIVDGSTLFYGQATVNV